MYFTEERSSGLSISGDKQHCHCGGRDNLCVGVPFLVFSLVVETFNPEKNGREAYFIPLETSFFIEKHIQNPLESPVGKSFYGCPRFCIIPIIPIIMTNHFCHRNYTVAAVNDLS